MEASRLSSLLKLLDSGSSVSREQAGQKIAQVGCSYPDQVDVLLGKIRPFCSSMSWETRVAASKAVGLIFANSQNLWGPADERCSQNLQSFALHDILNSLPVLLASEGAEYEPSNGSQSEARARIDEKLGLNPQFGISSQEWFSDEDLTAADHCDIPRKRSKLFHVARLTEDDVLAICAENCLTRFVLSLAATELWASNWEERHGALLVLRECFLRCRRRMDSCDPILSLLCYQLFCILSLDRFNDFVGAYVVAPVRESAAQVLASLFCHLSAELNEQFTSAVQQFVTFNEHTLPWECAHGVLLLLKYLIAATTFTPSLRSYLSKPLVTDFIIRNFRSANDDLCAVAAECLAQLLDQSSFSTRDILPNVQHIAWTLLNSWQLPVDGCAIDGSDVLAGTVLQLISAVDADDEKVDTDITCQRLTVIFPYIDNPMPSVRLNAAKCMSRVVRTAGIFLSNPTCDTVVQNMLRIIYQRILIDSDESVQRSLADVWRLTYDQVAPESLIIMTCPYIGAWLSFLMVPAEAPFLALNYLYHEHHASSSGFCQHVQLIGSEETTACLGEAREQLVLRNKLQAAELLASLFTPILRQEVPLEGQAEAPSVSLLALLNLHLTSGSAAQIAATCMTVTAWAKYRKTGSLELPNMLVQSISSILQNMPGCFQESIIQLGDLGQLCTQIAAMSGGKLPASVNLQGHILAPLEQAAVMTRANIDSLDLSKNVHRDCLNKLTHLRERLLEITQDLARQQRRVGLWLAGVLLHWNVLPQKFNPILKPIMDCIKVESVLAYSEHAAVCLSKLIQLAEQTPGVASPTSKLVRNLCTFLCSGHLEFLTNYQFDDDVGVAGSLFIVEMDLESAKESVEQESTLAKGAALALRTLVSTSGSDLPRNVRPLWNILYDAPSGDQSKDELLSSLATFFTVFSHVHSSLRKDLLNSRLTGLCMLTRSPTAVIRYSATRCIVACAELHLADTLQVLLPYFLSFSSEESAADTDHARLGCIESFYCLITQLEHKLIGYVCLFTLKALRLMSDSVPSVRQLAALAFARLVCLLPLETPDAMPTSLSAEWQARWRDDYEFFIQLTNPGRLSGAETAVIRCPGADLRTYQTEGVNWMLFLQKYHVHGILCDDMGLGKTLQTLCVLAASTKPTMLSLIVCPTSLVTHWEKEIRKFFGSQGLLRPAIYAGGPLAFLTNSDFNILITSYDRLRRDGTFLVDTPLLYCVLDEGHVIKNPKTQLFKAVSSIRAQYRLILSGTPIQNSVNELWALFEFLMPKFLGSAKWFKAHFTKPIVQSRDAKASSAQAEAGRKALDLLHKQVLPFILRRQKADVLKELPPKIVQDYSCDLSALQVELYDDFSRTLNVGAPGAKNMLQILVYLRKLCDHPSLVLRPTHPKYDSIVKRYNTGEESLNAVENSGKLLALRQLLGECGIGTDENIDKVVSGHRALIFCQFKDMVDLLLSHFAAGSFGPVTFLRLDGTVPAHQRQAVVDQFNEDPSIDVLLLTTQVGGLGLSLTGADVVIFIDHDWNPTRDLQAMDRAHRIGQTRTVNVYRLITRGTLEEKILNLQKFKTHIANTVISEDNKSIMSMETDQLLDLLSLDKSDQQHKSRKSQQDAGSTQKREKDGRSEQKLELAELWDQSQYEEAFDVTSFVQDFTNNA